MVDTGPDCPGWCSCSNGGRQSSQGYQYERIPKGTFCSFHIVIILLIGADGYNNSSVILTAVQTSDQAVISVIATNQDSKSAEFETGRGRFALPGCGNLLNF